jgi:hypothetical protein
LEALSRPLHKKFCPTCQRVFTTKRHDRITCSLGCMEGRTRLIAAQRSREGRGELSVMNVSRELESRLIEKGQ